MAGLDDTDGVVSHIDLGGYDTPTNQRDVAAIVRAGLDEISRGFMRRPGMTRSLDDLEYVRSIYRQDDGARSNGLMAAYFQLDTLEEMRAKLRSAPEINANIDEWVDFSADLARLAGTQVKALLADPTVRMSDETRRAAFGFAERADIKARMGTVPSSGEQGPQGSLDPSPRQRDEATAIKSRLEVIYRGLMPRRDLYRGGLDADLEYVRSIYRQDDGMFGSSSLLAAHFQLDTLEEMRAKLRSAPEINADIDEWAGFLAELVKLGGAQIKALLADPTVRISSEAKRAAFGFAEQADMKARLGRLAEVQAAIEKAAQEATESAQNVKEIAGAEAEGELAKHFKAYAKRQRIMADLARIAVILLTISLVLLLYLTLGIHPPPASWVELARKLSLGVPPAVLAAYLARESSNHRMKADWAEAIDVQLRTIRAYTDPLPEESRHELRAELGRRIFSRQPLAPAKPANGVPQWEQVAGLARLKDDKTARTDG